MISVRLRLFGFGQSPDRYGDQRACPERSRRVSLPFPATVATLLDRWAGELERPSPTGMPGGVAVERLLIIVNGRHIHHLQGLETPLVEGDVVTIMPPVVGG